MSKKTFIIFDGNSFIHRAYHALPAFTNKSGFPTQVITGVCNMINRVLKDFDYDKVVVAFDASGKNFRHEIYPSYKESRGSMPDDMRIQLEPLKNILSAWGLPMLSVSGVEADDSMSSLALQAEREGFNVIMVTSDKDMYQIINDNILILDTKSTESKEKMVPMNPEAVYNKFGVYPSSIVDYLALIGDTSDDVPGVYKCGHKTALKWLEAHNDIDGIIKNHSEITGKVGEYLKNSIDNGQLLLSRELVTIKKDVDLGKDASLFIGEMNEDALIELLNTYELRGLKKALNLIDKNAESASTQFILDAQSVNTFIHSLLNVELAFLQAFSFDSKEYILASNKKDDNVYVLDAFENKELLNEIVNSFIKNNTYISSIDSKNVLKTIFKYTENKSVFDILLDDARVVNYIQYGGKSKIASIEMLNNSHCNFNLSPLREKFSLNSANPKWDKMTFEETLAVLSEEIKICKHIISGKSDDFNINSAIVDNRMLSVLAYMEYTGVKIDIDKLQVFGKEIEILLENIEKEIYDISGEKFSISSPKQVGHILFNVLAIESKKKSTAEDVLSLLKDNNPIIGKILKWRSLSKLKSTYIDGLIIKADGENKVHTTYNLTLTSSTRLSSTEPNLQNIPVKSEDGAKIREAFIPSKLGYKIVKLDYSQIELRILAHLSKDKKLLEAFTQNKDLHVLTASQIFEIETSEVTDAERRIGKAINFGLIYGMSERRLALELGIEKKQASKYYRNYFRYFKGVKPYFELQLEKAREDLFVLTDSQRAIFTTDLNSPNPHARSHAEKSANNASIQGTASDIIKSAMIRIFDVMNETKIDAEMLMQVHDELIFEVREDLAVAFASKMKTLMENTTLLSIPLVVEYQISDNY